MWLYIGWNGVITTVIEQQQITLSQAAIGACGLCRDVQAVRERERVWWRQLLLRQRRQQRRWQRQRQRHVVCGGWGCFGRSMSVLHAAHPPSPTLPAFNQPTNQHQLTSRPSASPPFQTNSSDPTNQPTNRSTRGRNPRQRRRRPAGGGGSDRGQGCPGPVPVLRP